MKMLIIVNDEIKTVNWKIDSKSTDEVTYIDCSNLSLKALPPILEDNKLLNTLITLHCGYNQLTSLPTLPTVLTHLSCNNNKLTSLPTLPTRLKYLICYGNQLTSLPDLRPYTKLEFVDCDLVCFEFYMLGMANVEFEFYY